MPLRLNKMPRHHQPHLTKRSTLNEIPDVFSLTTTEPPALP